MKSVLLRAEDRSRGSKGSVHNLRRQGMLPAVVYGKDVNNLLIQVSEKELASLLAKHSIGGTLINLDLVSDNGEKTAYLAMIREVQRDPIRRTLLHADFMHISLTEEIETDIPVHLVGEAVGIKSGGILQHMLRNLTVACLPDVLPERLELNISKLDIGDQVTAGEVQLPAGVRVVNAPESVIAMVVNPAVEVEETVEAEEGVATDVAAPETEA